MLRVDRAALLAMTLLAGACSRRDDAPREAPVNPAIAARKAKIESAITRGVERVRTRGAAFDPRTALVLAYPQRTFAPPGLPPMAPIAFAGRDKPALGEFINVYGRLADPKSRVDQATIDAMQFPIDRVTAGALHCDRLGVPPDLETALTEMTEKKDDYSLPHAMLATGWAVDLRCLPEATAAKLDARQRALAIERLESRKPGLMTDSTIEMIAMLDYRGHRSDVQDAWIDAVLESQLPSGGWGNPGELDHTSALALWVLLEAVHPEVPRTGWLVRD
jgi:hypothetical protein